MGWGEAPLKAFLNPPKACMLKDQTLKKTRTLLFLGSRLPGTRPNFLFLPENRYGKEQVVFSGRGRRDPKISFALKQPRLAPVQPWGCSRARDNFGCLRPRPEKTTCSFPYRFSGENRNSGLVPGNRNPNTFP